MNRHRRKTNVASPQPTGYSGATLTEILMALMIMSIGVTSVATLFPLAIMRSVKATQLTNAALLRYQVDEIVDLAPTLLPFNMPVSNGDTATIGAGPAMFSGFPLGPNSVRVHIVDPLGYFKKTANPEQWDTYNIRSNGNFLNATVAQDFCVLGDSWVSEWSGVPDSNTASQVTLPAESLAAVETASQVLASGLNVRILLTSRDGKNMQSRNVATANSTTGVITFTPDLPSGANYTSLQNVRLQTFETRYSWMLTATTRLVAPGDDGVPGIPLWNNNVGTTYGAGDWVRITDSSVNQRYLECVQGGTPGGSEPSYTNTTAVGTSITDGTVVWVVSDQPDSGDTVTTELDLVVFFRRDFTSVAERTLTTLKRTETPNLNEEDADDEIIVDYTGATDPKPTFNDNQWIFVTSFRQVNGANRMTRGDWAQIKRVLAEDETNNQAHLQLDRKVWSNRDPRNATLTVFIPDGILDVYPLGIIGSDD